MENFTTNWTQEELKCYMLLYCANANFNVTKEEEEYIKLRVEAEKYKNILKEFEEDNDYQHIQKINTTIERLNYSKEEIDEIFQSIKKLFLSDGEMDILEQNIYRGLKHLLSK